MRMKNLFKLQSQLYQIKTFYCHQQIYQLLKHISHFEKYLRCLSHFLIWSKLHLLDQNNAYQIQDIFQQKLILHLFQASSIVCYFTFVFCYFLIMLLYFWSLKILLAVIKLLFFLLLSNYCHLFYFIHFSSMYFENYFIIRIKNFICFILLIDSLCFRPFLQNFRLNYQYYEKILLVLGLFYSLF